MKAIIARAAAGNAARNVLGTTASNASRNALSNTARKAARTAIGNTASNATRNAIGAAAALLLMAACTADNLPDDPAAGTATALTPGAVVTRIAEKPGYAPSPLEGGARRAGDVSTRTNPATGAWQTGEVVTASIYFYSDAAGDTDAELSQATQRLTYTAATAATTDADGKPLTAATPAKWSAVPALVSIPAKTRSLRVYYDYAGEPDPLTGTQERMFGYVAQASGSAISPDAPTTPFPPTKDNGYLIPIANATGTLALVTAFERQTAVVSLLMQPGQEVDFATAYIQPGWQFDESDNLYHFSASLPADAATAATAHFHLDAPSEAEADGKPEADAEAEADIAAAATFRLTLKDKPTETIYDAVPFRMGWQYQLDARTITGTGGGEGGNEQSVTATGLESLDTKVFNAQNPVWVITGGGADATATAKVAGNVRDALIAARDAAASGIPAGIELTLTSVKTLPVNAFLIGSTALTSLAAVHLPAATTIGIGAFSSCTKLETVSATATTIGMNAFNDCTALTLATLPAAATINEGAFRGCAALSTINLPAATGIGAQAFYYCTALSSISLNKATGIGVEAFEGCTALTTLSLPAATSIGANAFNGCTALASLSLTASGSITLDPKAFDGFTTSEACTLTLNADKKADDADSATPKVDAGGKTWGGKTWKEIKYE